METNWCRQTVETFEYPVIPCATSTPAIFTLAALSNDQEDTERHCTQNTIETISNAEVENLLQEAKQIAFEAGRQQGLQEGRRLEHEAQYDATQTAEQQRAKQMANLVEQFAQEHDRYLHEVESEVVKLALAVAARILRREAQMDPLLLTGAVRVALGQLSGSTEVRLRVPPAEFDLWKETVALLPHLTIKPQIISGEGMRLGECSIETKLGSVDLGIRSQLAEIERGFFGNAARPQPTPEKQTAANSADGDA